ncbi:hypothetical protein DS745_23630 [Anaerobacillus alkaliphilus]|uniref:Uncharacterized protein n=1 Tax=Anaerobacillus alkaliphilus TaxID=1548597 RepID=A0A4Q0VP91_9BACI|nr:hypothetical protein [Anaerobacillus alkaliphilus]RXI96692.1 hypothetical protein DS745_23630 [Anaerobacillus alkaliphilus]
MYYYPIRYLPYYPYQTTPLPYYPYPDPVAFDPYKVDLPKITHPANRCQKECLSMGYRPGTFEWQQCIKGCSYYLGSLLDDPQFIEDMMEK